MSLLSILVIFLLKEIMIYKQKHAAVVSVIANNTQLDRLVKIDIL